MSERNLYALCNGCSFIYSLRFCFVIRIVLTPRFYDVYRHIFLFSDMSLSPVQNWYTMLFFSIIYCFLPVSP